MAQQSASANGVRIALWSIVEEIDDDDEDVLEVTIEIHNQSAQDLWDLNGNIRDMDGTTALARSKPSRVEASAGDWLSFWVPSDAAAWLFKLTYNTDSGSSNLELGPFTNELRIEAKPKPKRSEQTKISASIATEASGGDPLAAAFGAAMDGFGEMEVDEPVLTIDVASDDPMQAAFAGGLLESQQVMPAAPANPPSIAPPPSEPVVAPSAPPAAPPASAFSAPPTGPPSGPPTGPPTGPPSGPPTGPPSGPPTGPPTGPPSGPPTGPPSGPPTGPPGAPPGPPPKSAGPPGPPPS